jgi:iron complex outermembrane receptor protein
LTVTDGEIVDVNGDGQIKAIVVNGKAIENEHLILDAKIITDLSIDTFH